MNKLTIAGLAILITLFATMVYAAPVSTLLRNTLPETTDRYDLGTTTLEWNGVYAKTVCISGDCRTVWPSSGSGVWPFTTGLTNYGVPVQATSTPLWMQNGIFASSTSQLVNASTTAVSATTLCLNGDTCRTTWPTGGSGGTGNVSTSTTPTIGQLAYWTTSGQTPEKLGAVSTTTLTFTGPFSGLSTLGALVGGSNSTIVWTGLSTTTQPSSSNLLVSNGAAGVYGIATSTLSATSPLTGSFVQIGSTGSLGIQQGTASQDGYISSTDWNTFNGKISTTSLALIDKGYFFSTTSADYWKTQNTFGSASTTLLADNNTWTGRNNFANSTSTLGTITTGWSTNWYATYASSTAITVSGNAYFPSGVWNSSGSVGIATTSPQYALSVVGTSTFYSNYMHFGASSPNNTQCSGISSLSASAVCIETWGNDNTAYGVSQGIGNASNGANAYTGLFLNNDQAADNTVTNYGFLGYNSSGYNDTTFGTGTNVANLLFLQNSNGALTLETSTTSATKSYINFLTGGNSASNERMRITSTGNVGIGTTSPSSLLQIASNSGGKVTLTDANASTDQKHWFMISDSGEFTIGTTSDSLVDSSVAALQIEANGEIGIGTNVPTSLLEIGGANSDGGGLLEVTGTYTGISSYANNLIDFSPTINANISGTLQNIRANPSIALSSPITTFTNINNNTTIASGSDTITTVRLNTGSLVMSAGHSGTLTNLVGYRYANPNNGGTGTVTNQVGLVVEALTGATNNTSILLGNSNLQSGNFGILSMTDYPNLFQASTTATTTAPLVIGSSRAAIVTNSSIGNLQFWSNDTNYTAPGVNVADIGAIANQTHNASQRGTDLVFRTTSGLVLNENMRLTGAGNLGIGDASPASLLTVGSGDLFQVDSSGNITSVGTLKITSASNSYFTGGGKLGISTTTPWGMLSVKGSDTSASTLSFVVSDSADTVLAKLNNAGLFTLISASSTNLSVNGTNVFGTSTVTSFITPERPIFMPYATTTWTGTSSPTVQNVNYITLPFAVKITQAVCSTDAGTIKADPYYGSTHLATISISSTPATTTFSSNNTPSAGATFYVKYGTPASSPTSVSCTFSTIQQSTGL